MKTHSIIISLLVFILLVSACAPQAETATLPPEPSPIPAPTETSTPMPTATPLPPVLMVGGDIPCYAGPGPDYETLVMLSIGMKAEVLSKDSTGAYWIVQSPLGNGSCWTESRYATIIGQVEGIPVLAANAVPTKTIATPLAPSKLVVDFSCIITEKVLGNYGLGHKSAQAIAVKLMWFDAKNETGYRIYKDGILLIELGPDVVEYQDLIPDEKGVPTKFMYALEAYNEYGSTQKLEIEIHTDNVCKGS